MDHRQNDTMVSLPMGSPQQGAQHAPASVPSLIAAQKPASDENWNGLWHYDEAPLLMAANSISTVLSSLLPTTSILILYFVKKPLARLAVTMLFTALFSLTLATVAKARRIDVFAATTA